MDTHGKPQEKTQGSVPYVTHKHAKALVVEDSPIVQKVHCRYLEDLGFQVDTAADGYSALELAAQFDYHCALLDIGLPDISGESVLSAIRYREQKTKRHLPIIVNTAHGDADLLQRCQEAGADAAFSKPIVLEKLRGVLAAALEQKEQEERDGAASD